MNLNKHYLEYIIVDICSVQSSRQFFEMKDFEVLFGNFGSFDIVTSFVKYFSSDGCCGSRNG